MVKSPWYSGRGLWFSCQHPQGSSGLPATPAVEGSEVHIRDPKSKDFIRIRQMLPQYKIIDFYHKMFFRMMI